MAPAILLTTRSRRRARTVAAELQAAIDEDRGGEGLSTASFGLLAAYDVPHWAVGVSVEWAGLLRGWAVVATEEVD